MDQVWDGQPSEVDAVCIPTSSPDDVRGLARIIDEGRFRADEVVAVTGKIEGSGSGTTRAEADRALRSFLASSGVDPQRVSRIPLVFTAGGIGILSPQIVVYARRPAQAAADGPRLAIGTARSAIIRPEWVGTVRAVQANAEAVRAAVRDGGMAPAAVEYVVGKAYHPALAEVRAVRAADAAAPPIDAPRLFRATSGSAGLGAAVALEGLAEPADGDIGERLDLWSGKASFSANPWEGIGEGPQTQVIALGNAGGQGGSLRVGHAVVNSLLDASALGDALRRAGLDVGDGPLGPEQRRRVVAVYVKVGPGPDGRLHGRRQLVESPDYTHEYKAAVGGLFAGILQDTLIYLSGSATHQGPPGGGTIAAVVDVG